MLLNCSGREHLARLGAEQRICRLPGGRPHADSQTSGSTHIDWHKTGSPERLSARAARKTFLLSAELHDKVLHYDTVVGAGASQVPVGFEDQLQAVLQLGPGKL